MALNFGLKASESMPASSLKIDDVLRAACDLKASDVHVKAGNYPHARVDGDLRPLSGFPKLTPDDTLALANSIMTTLQRERFKTHSDLDMAYSVLGVGRFRVNIFQQRGSAGMVFRVIPVNIRDLDALHLPKVVYRISEERRGLVLVTGTTGSGKSTTLAAIIDFINSTRSENIITIEDPLEFLHRDKLGFLVQREVEVDTTSFSKALRAALRQDPDVILVREMRDTETIETALIAAATGHMVYSTLHTTDAAETIHRVVASFPPQHQKHIRLQLASTLRAIISQRLVKKSDGVGRVPAVEILVATEYIRECIANPEKTRLIPEAIANGTSQYGMQTFDQSLHDLYSAGLISLEEALLQASKPDDLRLRIAGIRSSSDVGREQPSQTIVIDRFSTR
jgi:twitching motility protein PilT